MQKKKGNHRFIKLTLAVVMCLSIVTPLTNIVKANDEPIHIPAIIPKPLQYEVNEGSFTLHEQVRFMVKGRTAEETTELMNTAETIAKEFRASTGYAFSVEEGTTKEGNIVLTTLNSDEQLGRDGYQVETTTQGVEIKAYQPEGIFNGIQTLRQLLPPEIEKNTIVEGVDWTVPCTTIYDKPEYEYRGMMLDVSRHFFNVEQVKRQIDLASQYKINKLHMHLSDDQGWRLEIKGDMYGESLDKLRTIGAQTSTSINGINPGQYTQEEFKEIVRYASERYVEIIPEFDMPGHTWAALVSLNFLNSTEDGKPHSGKYDNTKPYEGIDVGFSTFEAHNEKTYEFIEEVFKQVSAISPSKYIHVGGDEAHSTPIDDYAYFCNRVTEIAKKYGKTAIGWQNYDGVVEDKENTLTQFWSTGNKQFLKDVTYVVSTADHAYMDMKYDNDSEFGLQWATHNPVDDAYQWDPTDHGSKDQIIGVEAPLWTETIATDYALDYMIYPRLPGHAEIGWTPKESRSWDEYKKRIAQHDKKLANQGVQYRRDEKIWEPTYDPLDTSWSLNEGSGTITADKTGDHPGTIKGNTTWIDGVSGKALHFDGTGYVDLGIKDLRGNWTIGLWVNRENNSKTNTVLISGSEGEIKLEQWKNTKKVGITKFGVKDHTFNYSTTANTWEYLTFVCDDTGTSFYVNGEFKERVDIVIKAPVTRIGANAKSDLADAGNMIGSLDEISLYNHAFSAEDVKNLYGTYQVDKTALGELIEACEDLEGDLYTTDSWSALQLALTNAKQVMESETASASDVEEAIKTLVNANDTLIKRASTQSIQTLRSACAELEAMRKEYSEIEFTEASKAIEQATLVLAKDEKNIGVKEVQESMMLLATAKGNLQHNVMLDALRVVCEQADQILASDELDNVRPGQIEVLRQAREAAQELIDTNCSDQVTIQQAEKTLLKAMQELYKIVDKENVKSLVEDAKTLQKDRYTEDSWTALMKALGEADELINNDDATTDEVQGVYDALLVAIQQLEIRVDKEALKQQLDIATMMIAQKDQYIVSTIKGLQQVVKEAEALYQNEEASQAEVSAMTEKLIQEMSKARLKADKKVLEEALRYAKGINFNNYTTTQVAGVKETIAKAQAIFENEEATQEEVNAIADQLQKEITALVEQKETVVKEVEKEVAKNVPTGDQSNTAGMVGLVMLSGIVVVCIRKRRNKA